MAHLFVGIEVANRRETEQLLAALRRGRIEAYDLSDNEMAKLHVRHLVGGRAPAAEHEILYRFEFPERPGALMRFLDSMSAGWNISLFHYRNHGADYGRVLVGMQVPPRTERAVPAFSRPPRLRLRRRIGQSGVPDVSRQLTAQPVVAAARTCRETAHPADRKLPGCCVFVLFAIAADSGKLYALVKLPGPWQTRLGPVRRGQAAR